MLFFSIAAKRSYVIASYVDEATGLMETDNNKQSMTLVTLRPKADFIGAKIPTLEQIEKMHHQAHEQCFIANSVKTKVIVEALA